MKPYTFLIRLLKIRNCANVVMNYKNIKNKWEKAVKYIYMLVHEIKEEKGGMTTAMFNRSKVFYDNHIPADIITFDYDPDYDSVIQHLKSSGKMDKRTNMYNVIEYFDEKSCNLDLFIPPVYTDMEEKIQNCFNIKNDKTSIRCFSKETGDYELFVRYKSDDEISHIDCFQNSKRFKRMFFKNKKVKKIEYYNENNKKLSEIIHNKNGAAFLNRLFNPDTQAIGNTYLLSEEKGFKNNVELSHYFLNSLIQDTDENVLICDGPGSLPKMLNIKKPNLKKFAFIHTNHFDKPYTYGSEVKKKEELVLKNAKALDGLIVLTEKQKEDIQKQYGINNIFVIPHFQVFSDVVPKKNGNKIVGYISRLNKNKGFDRLIKVVLHVHKLDAGVKFHIYGSGDYESELKQLINENNLNDVILLKGYTNKPKEAISTFDITVSSSRFEAFSLSIAESMEQEVPVVAMDINYGPSELIENDFNGYLVKDDDIKGMAKRIVKLVNDKNKLHEFGKNARGKVLTKFSTDKILKEWMKII